MIGVINKLVHLILPERKIWEMKNRRNIPSMEWSLLNLKKLGFYPTFAIDAGAYNGEWTKMFKGIFPSAKVLMIEAQKNKEEKLKTIAGILTDTYYHIGLLGEDSGKPVTFNIK